jgi:hypothetical protein
MQALGAPGRGVRPQEIRPSMNSLETPSFAPTQFYQIHLHRVLLYPYSP